MRESKPARSQARPLSFSIPLTHRQRVHYEKLLKFLVILLVGTLLLGLWINLVPPRVRAESSDAPSLALPAIHWTVPSSGLTLSPALLATTNSTTSVYSGVTTWGGSGAFTSASRAAVDDAGNLYVAGEFQGTVDFDPARQNPNAIVTSNNNSMDAFLSKFDSNRHFLWVRTWGTGGGRDAASGVAVDGSGNAYVAGLYQGTVDFGSGFIFTSNAPIGNNNIFVAKFDAYGTTLWAHTWGGTIGGEGYSIAIDRANGVVYVQGDWSTNPTTGTVDFNQNDPAHPDPHANHGFYDAFLSKFDLNGHFQWARTWGGHGYDDGDSVTVDGSGNIYVCGMYGSTDIDFDPAGSDAGKGHEHGSPTTDWWYMNVFLSKFDSGGNFQWVRTWGGLNTDDAGGAVVTDGLGNVYAGGRFDCANCNFNDGPIGPPAFISTTGDLDAFVSKYDANGNFVWVRTWGGSQKESVFGLAVDGANNLYASGLISGVTNQNYAYISADASFTKLTFNGTTQWTKTWGGTGFDTFTMAPVLDAAGNAYLAGSFQSTVNFNTDGGTDNHAAVGTTDAFLTKFVLQLLPNRVYLPLLTSP